MIQASRVSLFKKFLIVGITSGAILTGVLVYQKTSHGPIQDYDPARDREFILNVFKNNYYWLVNDPEFSPEYMLDNKASSKKPKDKGNLTIKTYVVDGKPVAFTAYYPKKLYEGFVLFLAVDAPHRGRGYARQLLAYDIDQLKKQGSAIIRLITRTDNTPARKLYDGMGFIGSETEDKKYVKYVKRLEIE